MRRAPLRAAILAFVGAVIVFAVATGWGVYHFSSPRAQEKNPGQIIVFLPRGMPLVHVAKTLHRAGAIDHPLLFEWGVRVLGAARRLKAGEYGLPAHSSPRQVMEVLLAGKTLLRSLTIPEGLTTAEVLQVLRSEEGLTGELPGDVPEGWLLPETYKYERGDRRADVMRRMMEAMAQTLNRLWPTRKQGLPFTTPLEALVLASLVEKETAVPDERAQVAGVFVNRLRRGMRLQSDPTVVYAVTQGAGPLDRALTFDDLRTDNPFNTYRIKGLPPRPIANAGTAAIEATLRPADTDALYFVADGVGGHVFAKSLEEHQKNVRQWRALKARK